MIRPFLWLLAALLASPAVAFGVYWLARELGFLDPPTDRQHELRRTILLALFAFLLLLPVGIYGFEKGWPRVWILFGMIDVLATLFFAAGGIWAAVQLWRIRHPADVSELPPSPESPGLPEGFPADAQASAEGDGSEILGREP